MIMTHFGAAKSAIGPGVHGLMLSFRVVDEKCPLEAWYSFCGLPPLRSPVSYLLERHWLAIVFDILA